MRQQQREDDAADEQLRAPRSNLPVSTAGSSPIGNVTKTVVLEVDLRVSDAASGSRSAVPSGSVSVSILIVKVLPRMSIVVPGSVDVEDARLVAGVASPTTLPGSSSTVMVDAGDRRLSAPPRWSRRQPRTWMVSSSRSRADARRLGGRRRHRRRRPWRRRRSRPTEAQDADDQRTSSDARASRACMGLLSRLTGICPDDGGRSADRIVTRVTNHSIRGTLGLRARSRPSRQQRATVSSRSPDVATSSAQAGQATSSGATSSAGSRSATGISPDAQQPQRDPDQQQPTGRGDRGEVRRRGARRPAATPSSGQRALDHDAR